MTQSCVILDLDSTLINTFGYIDTWDIVSDSKQTRVINRIYNIKSNSVFMWGTKRPYTKEFLDACFDNFDIVGVWSAGVEAYVTEIVEEIFDQKPDFIWSREKCIETVLEDGDKIHQKPFSRIFKEFKNIDPQRTIIFDDYESVCGQNTLYHVHVKPWEHSFDGLTKPDLTLKKAADWIKKKLRNANDYKTISIKEIKVM